MTDRDRTLELSREELETMIQQASERILHHLSSLPAQPLDGTREEDPATTAERVHEPTPPELPTPMDELLDTLFEDAIPRTLNTPHAGYLAYIPGGGLPQSAIADLISGATNRYVATWFAAPALARMEADVIEWFCRLVGYPDPAFGLLTTGGSMANQIAITTARRERLPEDFLSGTIYVSDQAHHSVAKSAVLSGFPARNVREIPSDDTYRIQPGPLEEMIATDRANGLDPFLIVANAGSTNTGAVDDLDALADISAREQLWLHADAAYGGFFVLTAAGKERLSGIERCDSITLDPHKGLFLPYGTGSLLVRDGSALARAHAVSADYIPTQDEGTGHGLVDFSQLSPELSRDFRGLRAWLPLKLHGLAPFRANLEEKLALARFTADELAAMPDVRIVAQPQLSTLAFRLEPAGLEGAALDELNQAWMQATNDRQRVHLSGTVLGDRFTLRVSIVSFRTHREHVEACIEDLRAARQAVLD